MLRAAPFLLAALVLTACGCGSDAPATTDAEPLSGDVAMLVEHVATRPPRPVARDHPVDVLLPETGLAAHVAGEYRELAPRGDEGLAFEPHVPVELSAGDYVAGRDPVLTAALGRAPR